MTRYQFVLSSPDGNEVVGSVEGADPADATAQALRPGYTLLSLTPDSQSHGLGKVLSADVRFSKLLSTSEFLSIIREWATLVGSGVPLLTTLQFSLRGRKGMAERAVREVCEAVRSGNSLQIALTRSGLFPQPFIALIGAAEASGLLAETLARTAAETEARMKIAARLRNEMIYPAFLTVTAAAAILVLLAVVVPTLQSIVGEEGAKRLSPAARMMIATSLVLRDYWPVLFVAPLAPICVAFGATRTRAGKVAGARAITAMPLVGALLRDYQIARYLEGLAGLTAGGVPLIRAQAYAYAMVSNQFLAERLSRVEPSLAAGNSLAMSLEDAGVISEDVLSLVRNGETTGRLAAMLSAGSRLLQTRADHRLEGLVGMLGPTLTLLFGLVAGLIVYTMLTTILSLNELAF